MLGRPKKNSVVMVGDREHDVIGAQGNAMDSIAVTYGYGSLLELQRANPTYFAHAVEDIGALTS
jgi:phosphoglycolate phosphatase